MRRVRRAALLIAFSPTAWAFASGAGHQSIDRFLQKDHAAPSYRAARYLQAENGARTGWMEAMTEYSPDRGFTYEITAEGGEGSIRSRVLKAVLEGERKTISGGEAGRATLAPANYTFHLKGLGEDGLVAVALTPRRKEPVLLSGVMLLHPDDGQLMRVEGRLAKSPSFWIKNVDIVRTYERIGGAVVPVALESRAQVRWFGAATFRMTYTYSEVNGRPVR